MHFKREDLKQQLKETFTTQDVFSQYYGSCTGSRGGRNYIQVECPNCHKKTFTLYPNICRCYHCEINGKMDIFSLYMYLNNTNSFSEALFGIAKDFGVISHEEYDKFFGNRQYKNSNNSNNTISVNADLIAERKRLAEEKEKLCPKAPLQSAEVIHNVYTVIKELYPITDKKLRNSLKKHRNLTDERIDAEYFQMPYIDNNFYKRLFATIKERFGYEPLDLIGVPGFFSYNKKTVLFVKNKGLGLLMSGANGIVYGIQIRAYDKINEHGEMIIYEKKDKDGKVVSQSKYYWCGSSSLPNGCGPGSPVDVMIPVDTQNMFKTCFITEGKFKEEKIVEGFNSPAISVQGVGNWVGKIAPEIKYISENYKEIKHIYCAYDSDMAFNFKVFNQCKTMIEKELEPLNVSTMMVVWDYHYGKGIDDVLDSGNRDKIKAVNFYVYADLYEKFRDKIMTLYPNTMETRILDENLEKVDSEIVYPIYRDMVLEPLRVHYL